MLLDGDDELKRSSVALRMLFLFATTGASSMSVSHSIVVRSSEMATLMVVLAAESFDMKMFRAFSLRLFCLPTKPVSGR